MFVWLYIPPLTVPHQTQNYKRSTIHKIHKFVHTLYIHITQACIITILIYLIHTEAWSRYTLTGFTGSTNPFTGRRPHHWSASLRYPNTMITANPRNTNTAIYSGVGSNDSWLCGQPDASRLSDGFWASTGPWPWDMKPFRWFPSRLWGSFGSCGWCEKPLAVISSSCAEFWWVLPYPFWTTVSSLRPAWSPWNKTKKCMWIMIYVLSVSSEIKEIQYWQCKYIIYWSHAWYRDMSSGK